MRLPYSWYYCWLFIYIIDFVYFMKKVLKGIINFSIVTSIIFLMIPFNIHAENVGGNAPIIGVNITVTDYEYSKIPVQATVSFETDQTRWQCMSSHSTMGCQVWQSQNTSGTVQNDITGRISYTTSGTVEGYLYEYDFVFDNNYVGYVVFSSGSIGGTTAAQYFVNGSHLVLTSTQLITAFTISSYSLNVISGDSSWQFPIESYTFINEYFKNNISQVGFATYGNYMYPVFNIKNGESFINSWFNTGYFYRLVFMTGGLNLSNVEQLERYFPSGNLDYQNFKILNRFGVTSPQNFDYLIYVELANNTGSNGNFQILANLPIDTVRIVPIFAQQNNYENILSTDFALNFGLSNRLLDDLDLIANGTTQSNQSASDLESANDQMASDMNDLANIESGYNQQFNNSLQTIDFSNPMQSNTGMLPAANFVISIFNGLISNNPFSVLIIIVCILLIGKKVIGK